MSTAVRGLCSSNGESASFLTLNRGKRSIELDLGEPAHRARIDELLAEADVLVENMRPGALAKFDLDYTSVSADHPRLVYCSISAFGQEGPLAGAGGYDVTIQALSGLMAMTGHPGQAPAKIPVAALDFGSALYAVVGILAALAQRERTGRGQQVQTSLLECALGWLSMHIVTYLLGGEEPGPLGSRSPFFAPYEAYRTADGYLVVVGTGGRDAWGSLCRELGLDRLIDDPRFVTNSDRVVNAEELRDELEAVLQTETNEHWAPRLEAVGVACAPVQRLHEVLESEQARILSMVGELAHAAVGPRTDGPATADALRHGIVLESGSARPGRGCIERVWHLTATAWRRATARDRTPCPRSRARGVCSS